MVQKGLGKGLGALFSIFDEDGDNNILDNIVEKPQKSVKINSTASNDALSSPGGVKHPAATEIVTRVTTGTASGSGALRGPNNSGIAEVDISLIDNNINQPRKDFDESKLNELAESIRSNGIVQPIVLSIVGTRYMIVAGERRWRAAKIAGVQKIPAVIRSFSPSQIAEIAIVENLQRQDLNEIELARGIKKLIDNFKLTQEQASARLGKNRSAIAHTLRLLTLPPEVIQMVEQNKLSAGHARCLVTLSDKNEAIKLARRCIQDNLSVRELEKLVFAKTSTSVTFPKYKAPQSLEIKEMIREMTSLFKTKVAIQGDTHKGRLIIDYFTSQDLIRIKKHVIDVNKLISVDDEVKSRVKGYGVGIKL